MSLVKVGSKNQVIIPKKVRDELGIEPGDYVEISFEKNRAVITRKKLIDDIPYTDEPLGPESQAGLKEALEDVAAGRVSGPYKTAEELQDYLDSLKKRG
jgi:AbrB family looped-hinge helix DNA binding protein